MMIIFDEVAEDEGDAMLNAFAFAFGVVVDWCCWIVTDWIGLDWVGKLNFPVG
jgi:hypothetical protein